jgi:hypothetical protein
MATASPRARPASTTGAGSRRGADRQDVPAIALHRTPAGRAAQRGRGRQLLLVASAGAGSSRTAKAAGAGSSR